MAPPVLQFVDLTISDEEKEVKPVPKRKHKALLNGGTVSTSITASSVTLNGGPRVAPTPNGSTTASTRRSKTATSSATKTPQSKESSDILLRKQPDNTRRPGSTDITKLYAKAVADALPRSLVETPRKTIYGGTSAADSWYRADAQQKEIETEDKHVEETLRKKRFREELLNEHISKRPRSDLSNKSGSRITNGNSFGPFTASLHNILPNAPNQSSRPGSSTKADGSVPFAASRQNVLPRAPPPLLATNSALHDVLKISASDRLRNAIETSPAVSTPAERSIVKLPPSVSAESVPATTQIYAASHSPRNPALQIVPLRPSVDRMLPLPASPPRPISAAESRLGARKFDTSIRLSRAGLAYTDGEVIMVGYLYERLGMLWPEVDRKMGRTHNTCATKHCRVPTGLKNDSVKKEMKWDRNVLAIDAMLATQNLTIDEVVQNLDRFIGTGDLPTRAADEYDRLAELQAVSRSASRSADSHSAIPDVVASQLLPRTLTAGSHLHPLTMSSVPDDGAQVQPREHRGGHVGRSRLRPGARVSEGQLSVRAMVRSQREQEDVRHESPDSVLATTPEIATISDQSTLSLFDVDDDEFMPDAYSQRKRPYLSRSERKTLAAEITRDPHSAEDWAGITLHYSFLQSEIEAVGNSVDAKFPLKGATPAHLAAVASMAQKSTALKSRSRASILNFLQDASSERYLPEPSRLRIKYRTPEFPSSNQLLQRELGTRTQASNHHNLHSPFFDSLAVAKSYTGASGDIHTVAWSPNGAHFAAGALCVVDDSSMQYNRPNNLLLGNAERSTLYELPHHHRQRTKPAEGVNSTHSMHTSQDPRLFETVSMVDFSTDSRFMFSAGYDGNLRAFDLASGRKVHGAPINHGAKIDMLAISRHHQKIATGAAQLNGSIKIFGINDSSLHFEASCSSTSAQQRGPDKKIMPSSLKWGIHTSVSNCLLAGFATHAATDQDAPTSGELCLWNIETQQPVAVKPHGGNIFDCVWDPSSHRMATACSAHGPNLNRGTKSLVRIFDPKDEPKWTCRGRQLECPALDINDVVFNPYNPHYITAGATDGVVYVWDARKPDDLLHTLRHGPSLMALDEGQSAEAQDTGVRYCAWGHNRSRLFSGSSDGILKVWDIFRSTEDALVKDVASFNSGIMSGAFNADFSSLLIGEVDGSLNLLEIGAESVSRKEVEKFFYEPYESIVGTKTQSSALDPESGISTARTLLAEGRIELQPFGGLPIRQAVKGPCYDGPYDYSPSTVDLRLKAAEFQNRMFMEIPKSQCNLPACKETGKHFVTDDLDDSGRSADRIPQAMRDVVMISKRATLGNLKCTYCGNPARVRENDLQQAAYPLCERCGFACLRCGKTVKVSALVDKIRCHDCNIQWDINVLGYSIVKAEVDDPNSDSMKGVIRSPKPASGRLKNMGDLLHLVEEYHHSLWEDRPDPVF